MSDKPKLDVYKMTPGDLRRLALKEGRKGQAAVGIPGKAWNPKWNEAAFITGKDGKQRPNQELIRRENAQIPATIAKLFSDLPPIVRRTPRQKYESLVQQLADYAIQSLRATGKVHWPQSILLELKKLGWMDGDPRLDNLGTLEGAMKQIEDLAHKWTPEFANKQRAKDAKRTTLDWSGHYNA